MSASIFKVHQCRSKLVKMLSEYQTGWIWMRCQVTFAIGTLVVNGRLRVRWMLQTVAQSWERIHILVSGSDILPLKYCLARLKWNNLETFLPCLLSSLHSPKVLVCFISENKHFVTILQNNGTVKSRYLELGYLEFCEVWSVYLNQKIHFDCFLQP